MISMSEKKRIVGYIRVSTTKQKDEGVSLEAQERKIRLYADMYDLDLVSIEVDVGSGKSMKKRKALRTCLKMMEDGKADGMLITKLDRLTRRVRDICFMVEEYFQDKTLISVNDKIDTNTPTGRLMLNLLTTFAQWERETISHRTQEAMQYLKGEGVKFGRCPYGWRYGDYRDERGRRQVEEIPDEQLVIKRIQGLRSMGDTLATIAEKLTRDGVPTKRGGAWQPITVSQILNRAERFKKELASA